MFEAGIKKRRTGDNYSKFSNPGKLKVFSKSYDHKLKKGMVGYKRKGKRERVSGINSVEKQPEKKGVLSSTKYFHPIKARKSSSRLKKSNKIFLSHREFLKKKKGTGSTKSSKGFFSKNKLGNRNQSSRDKHRGLEKSKAKALPGLNSYVSQVPESKESFLTSSEFDAKVFYSKK